MKTKNEMKLKVSGVLIAMLTLLINVAAHAADTPQSFTLDGQLFADTQGSAALTDSNIGMKIQILDEDRVCVLYEETQSINTVFSKGYFSVQVGSAALDTKRSGADTGNTMSAVFQNLTNVTGKKVSDNTACTVTAVGGKRRYVRVAITPASLGGAARVLSPDINIDSVPNSIVAERAETLQGLRGSDFLKVNTASGNALTQTNLESFFSSAARVTALSAVVDGTSNNYIKASGAGAQLPVFTGAPTSPVQGSFWFDSTDQKLKYRTSTTTEIIGNGGGSGTVTSVAAAATSGNPISIGGTASVAPTVDIAPATASANGYLKSSDWTIFNNKQTATLADGSIWAGNVSNVATAVAPSGDVTMSNAGAFKVTKLQGSAVSATAPTEGYVLKYTSSVWTPALFSIGDLKTAAGAQQFAGSTACTAAQTLTWSSLTDTFTCSNIALAGSAITSGTIDVARLPAGVGAWTAASGNIYRDTGYVGIGTTTPDGILDVDGGTITTASGTSINMTAQSSTFANSTGGHVNITGGAGDSSGGSLVLKGGASGPWAQAAITVEGNNFSNGGDISIIAGGGNTNANPPNVLISSGATANNGGGPVTVTTGAGNNAKSGSIYVVPGAAGGTGAGDVVLGMDSAAAVRGNVGVGTAPGYGFHVKKDSQYFTDASGNPYIYATSGGVGIGSSSTPSATLDVGGKTSTQASIEGTAAYVNSGASYTIPDTNYNIRRIDLTANAAIDLPAFTAPAGRMYSLTVFLRQDATGSRTVNFTVGPGIELKWDSGAAPTISSTAGKVTVLQFMKASDENVWYGSMVWKEN